MKPPTKYIARPIPHEIGRFWVNSSRADQNHVVDIVDVQCSCIGWGTREKKHRALHGTHYRCVHLKCAAACAYNNLIETMRVTRDPRNPNQK
jgi:hypothetical protein